MLAPIFTAHQQNNEQSDYQALGFINPIKLPLRVSGNFAEVRSNHFHSGIDFKTEGTIGHPIYAVADGYISRIKVSPFGYGKALYITHENGFTTVYAHLNKYADSIQAYVQNEQYRLRKYAVDIYPPKGQIIVKQGEQVAKSGNTGGSSGPHLHFEIRETNSEMPVNPLLFKMEIKDTIKPIIEKMAIYAMNRKSGLITDRGTIKAKSKKVLNVKRRKGNYYVNNIEKIKVQGKIGFGISAYDRVMFSHNKLGVYAIELFIDDDLIYRIEKDKFSFYETRYVNAHIDYGEKIKTRRLLERTHVMPGDKLSMYELLEKRGIYEFKDNKQHRVQMNVEDAHGNVSTLKLDVWSTTDLMIFPKDTTRNKKMIYYNHHNSFDKEALKVRFPEFAFYESFFISYSKQKPSYKGVYSDVHILHNKEVPIHKYYDLSIKAYELDSSIMDKTLIASINKYGRLVSEGGSFKDGWVNTKTRTFGEFMVTIDTIPPKVRAINVHNGKNISNLNEIRISIWDNFSGIDGYEGYINGDWVLFEYDAKYRLLTYKIDHRLKKGNNELVLTVRDEKQNESKLKLNLYR